MTKTYLNVLLISIVLITPGTSFAYIGPGMGGGVIVAVLGILGAIFIGLFGILYFPIKRALQRRKNKAQKQSHNEEPDNNNGANENKERDQ